MLQLHDNTMAFKNTLKIFITKNAFYSINEFMSGNHYEEQFKFLRKEIRTMVEKSRLYFMNICKVLDTIICNNLQYSNCKLYIAVGL